MAVENYANNTQNNKSNIRVLLVTSVSSRGFGFYDAPPIGLYRLKFYLEERGIECNILDLDFESKELALIKVEDGGYNVIGFSVSHYSMEEDLKMLWEFQNAVNKSKRKAIFIAGGQEATLNYEQWLNAGIEFILTGFGEELLYRFCLNISEYNSLSENVYNLEGIIYRKNNKTVINAAKSLTKLEFEELSYEQMIKIKIPYKKYWDKLRSEVKNINVNTSKFVIENVRLYTTSHCPRGCGFCSSQSFIRESQKSNSKILMLSAIQVYSLILHHIREYKAKSFLFSDDDFLVGNLEGLKRIYELCEMIIEGKQKGEIPDDIIFNCQARIADFLTIKEDQKLINYELINLLLKAGFQTFGLGVETFSDNLLKSRSINKIGVNVEDCNSVLNALLDKGLSPQINIIIGIPESTVDELLETIQVAVSYIERGCLVAVSNKLFMIPGSPIFYSGAYNVAKVYIKNPITDVDIEITKYIIPDNKDINMVVENIEKRAEEELKLIVKDTIWETSIVPRTILCMSYFIAIAKLLNKYVLVEEFYNVVRKVKQKALS